MMRWLISSSVRLRLIVLAAAAVLLAVGVGQLRDAPADVLPEFAPPHVEVQTEALGLSASEVESLVSLNVEELLNSTPWLDSIQSTSVPGLSSVVLTFAPGTDVLRARQIVAERLALAYALPNVSSPPVILQPLSASSRVLMVGLSSAEVSPIQMSVLTRWTIRPALLAVPGVANVTIWGYKDRQLQVQVDPKRLAKDDISLDQIVRTAGNAMWVSPLTYLEASTPGTGGWIDTPQQRLEVRHVFPISDPAGLARVRLEDRSGSLGDVADVVEGHPPLIGDAVLRNGPGVLLVVEKFPGADTFAVTKGVEDALDKLGPGLEGIAVDSTIFRPSTFIDRSIDNLSIVLIIGAILCLIVVLAFLYQWRAAVVSVLAVGLSLITAALTIRLMGETINAMVVAGLMIGLVVVVDEVIIGVENVLRRPARDDEGGAAAIVLSRTTQVQRVAIYATLIALLPLLPVLFMTGVSASLFQPLALAYALTVIASVIVALTVTPALCALLLSRRGPENRESPLAHGVQRLYGRALDRVLALPGPAFVAAALALAGGVAAVPFLEQAQLPEFRDPHLVVRWDGPAGTSAPEMTRITERLTDELAAVPGVRNVAGQVGRAILGDQVGDINSAEVFVKFEPGADYDTTLDAVRGIASGYPGLRSEVQTYQRLSVRRAQTGSDDPITVSVFGPGRDVLATQAERVARALGEVDGVDAVTMEQEIEQPHIEITTDLARAQRYGLKPGDVRREAATLLAGLEVGSLFEEQKVFQVAVWSQPDIRQSLTDVEDLVINTPRGGSVSLGEVADVRVASSPAVIRHEAVSRRVKIGVDVGGGDAGAVLNDIETRLAGMTFPLEYHVEVRGESSDDATARTLMIGAGIVAAIGVFLLLQAAFGSWLLASLLALALPFALSGGALAAIVAGDVVTLGSLAAFLAVLAITARAGILLIGRYRQLEEDDGVPFGRELVVRGARERALPVLVTALAVALALVPVLVTGARAGQEIAHPIAVIVLGGLVTSTAVSLFLLPLLYLRLGSRSQRPTGAQARP